MASIASFVFSPFAENTYVVWDESSEAVIIDPGCLEDHEQKELKDFIESKSLKPVKLLNTHCHLDHVFGNQFVKQTWGLLPESHEGEQVVLDHASQAAKMYGIPYIPGPDLARHWNEGDVVEFGQTKLEVLLVPGHSPASICFYNREEAWMICGDTIFEGSVGRMDLPGGDGPTLMRSITEKIMSLPDEVKLYPGHMGSTTVGAERRSNPFLLAYERGEEIF
jgi:glyoxylase-like metal-dependent hydrolase (beta-lactamase superfamily II)